MGKIKEFIKKYLNPIVILGICVLGFFNLGLFGYKFNVKFFFVAIAVVYSIFYIDGFWDMLKKWFNYITGIIRK